MKFKEAKDVIFISHVSDDREIANILKEFLEKLFFMNVEVFVSGKDLEGGQIWVEELRQQLERSQAIVSVISPQSINSDWVNFESGVGFLDERTIPFVVQGNLWRDFGNTPLKYLQACKLTSEGVTKLVEYLCSKFDSERVPQFDPDDLIVPISNIITNRRLDTRMIEMVDTLQKRAANTIRKALAKPLGGDVELEPLSFEELVSLSNSHGILIPTELSILLVNLANTRPSLNAPQWEKDQLELHIAKIQNAIENYETKLGMTDRPNNRTQSIPL